MADASARLDISWKLLPLCVPPLAFLLLGDWLSAQFGWHGAIGLTLKSADFVHIARQDAIGRLYVIAALVAASAASFLGVLLFISDGVRLFDKTARLALFAAAAAALTIGGIAGWATGAGERVPNYLGTGFVYSTTCQLAKIERSVDPRKQHECGESGSVPKPAKQGHAADNPLFGGFNLVVGISWLVLSLGAAAAILGGVSCLALPAGKRTPAQQRDDLARQRGRLRIYVNIAATLMVATMLFLLAWTRWPLFLLEGRQATDYLTQANTLTLFYGIVYSAVILSFAAPVAALLRERWEALPPVEPAAAGEPNPDAGELDTSMLASLGRVLVAFAPALAGIMPTAIEIFGHFMGA